MSTRYMKRIYGGDAIHDIGNGSASETEIPNEPKSKSFNVFDVVHVTINFIYYYYNVTQKL